DGYRLGSESGYRSWTFGFAHEPSPPSDGRQQAHRHVARISTPNATARVSGFRWDTAHRLRSVDVAVDRCRHRGRRSGHGTARPQPGGNGGHGTGIEIAEFARQAGATEPTGAQQVEGR